MISLVKAYVLPQKLCTCTSTCVYAHIYLFYFSRSSFVNILWYWCRRACFPPEKISVKNTDPSGRGSLPIAVETCHILRVASTRYTHHNASQPFNKYGSERNYRSREAIRKQHWSEYTGLCCWQQEFNCALLGAERSHKYYGDRWKPSNHYRRLRGQGKLGYYSTRHILCIKTPLKHIQFNAQ